MPKIAYIEKKLSAGKMELITRANLIIAEYSRQGYRLTLRQLYYQFVSRGWIANKQQEYKRLGEAVGDGRMCGMIDWYAIEDRTRSIKANPHWTEPQKIFEAAAEQYRIDKWSNQPIRPFVLEEKDALGGVIIPVCSALDISFLSCRGYPSLSEMWSLAMKLKAHIESEDQQIVIIHLGDHDPSGIDMTRDLEDRLSMFVGEPIEVARIALNYDQIQEYAPPPNPAKFSDPRANGYIERFGYESWELDALEPRVLRSLIEEKVSEYRDEDLWEEMVKQEKEERMSLIKVARHWEEVNEHVEELVHEAWADSGQDDFFTQQEWEEQEYGTDEN